MKTRNFISCLTCDHISTVRISVGHNPIQRHDFACAGCEEPIGLSLHLDYKNRDLRLEFCENSAQAYEEGTIINLDPHFLIKESEVNKDHSFSWMQEALGIMSSSIDTAIIKKPSQQFKMIDTYEQLGGMPGITEFWKSLKKGWSLQNKKKTELASKVLKKYDPKGFTGKPTLHSALKDFTYRLTLPKAHILTKRGFDALNEAKKANANELKKFAQYYVSNMREEHLQRYFDTFCEFFEDYSEYDQTILYVKNLAPVSEGLVASSYGFNRTKMFYGNAYENYTSNISILACLNNIIAGRPFDQFQSMDLKKYLTINKANRGNPFAENTNLSEFLTCTESTLRNASHHQSMSLINKGKDVQYRSGGTGEFKFISYSKYLEMCSAIILSTASLYQLEMELYESI
jgi:hypothetical protein